MPNYQKENSCTCKACRAIRELKEFYPASEINQTLTYVIELALQSGDIKTGVIAPAEIADSMSILRNFNNLLAIA